MAQHIGELSDRMREIFGQVVEAYLERGIPVGSKTLTGTVNLSPASIRGVMQDLEERGLLTHPHTSAGRIPTETGLRLFVDGIMQVAAPDPRERREIERQIARDQPIEDALAAATAALSGLSQAAGVVLAPKSEMRLKQLGLVPLGPDRALAVLVGADGSIENRIVDWAQNQSPVGYLANTFGAQVVSSQLMSGFTVVRSEEGDAFALGILLPPERPRQPFKSGGEGRVLVDADTAEVRVEQVDFIGPIVIEDSGQSLFFKYQLTGPAAEALLWTRAEADAWREQLQAGAALAPPSAPPGLAFPLTVGVTQEQRVPLPPGQYVLVVDNSSRVGRVNPPWNPLNAVGVNPVLLSYRLEVGETP